MLSKLKEEDFGVLRGPFESGRQSPESFSGNFILSIFLQILMMVATYVVAADASKFPYIEGIFVIHILITGLIIIFSVVYAIPSIYI